MTTLWPPLSQVRADLLGEARPSAADIPVIPHGAEPSPRPLPKDPEAPLMELAHRRQAARTRYADQPWEPGCVVLARQGQAHVGVLLDLHDAEKAVWHGWVTSAEADWAGLYDVLLEEDDGPSDPSASVVQAWNRIRISEQSQASEVLAFVGPGRLAAIRAVWAESLSPVESSTECPIAPSPGQVALRETPDQYMVLTGTPFGPNDPRLEHHALYRDLGQRMIEDAQAFAVTQTAPVSYPAISSWWTRLRAAVRTDGLWRPAFALLALVVVAQQWMIWQGPQEDEVHFRGGTPAATQPPALVVRWQPATRVAEAQALLKTLSAHPDIGILPDGRWYIEVDDPANARALLTESGLVQSVEGPR